MGHSYLRMCKRKNEVCQNEQNKQKENQEEIIKSSSPDTLVYPAESAAWLRKMDHVDINYSWLKTSQSLRYLHRECNPGTLCWFLDYIITHDVLMTVCMGKHSGFFILLISFPLWSLAFQSERKTWSELLREARTLCMVILALPILVSLREKSSFQMFPTYQLNSIFIDDILLITATFFNPWSPLHFLKFPLNITNMFLLLWNTQIKIHLPGLNSALKFWFFFDN